MMEKVKENSVLAADPRELIRKDRIFLTPVKDDSAVAYGIFVIAVFIIGATAAWVVIMKGISDLTINFNDFIAAGIVSQDTVTVYGNQLTLANFLPIIMLIGVFLWGIVRALERKGLEG